MFFPTYDLPSTTYHLLEQRIEISGQVKICGISSFRQSPAPKRCGLVGGILAQFVLAAVK